MNKKNSWKIYLFFTFIFLSSVTFFYLVYKIKYQEDFKGTKALTLLYNQPDTSGVFLGKKDASITIITYSRISCESCKQYYKEVFPILKEYIDSGKARYYHKFLITNEDIGKKTLIYNETMQVYCSYTSQEDFLNAYEKDNLLISPDSDCMQNTPDLLIETAKEIDFFGITTQPTIYIGISGKDNSIFQGLPSEAALRRDIRFKEVYLGLE